MEKLNITQWAEEDRPREKMASLGAGALTSAELLAILIGSGSTKESAVDLMKRILGDCNNNLNTLGKLNIHDLCSYNGIGEALQLVNWGNGARWRNQKIAQTLVPPPGSITTCTPRCRIWMLKSSGYY